MTIAQIRPYKRTSDDQGNVSMEYGRPLWEAVEPSDWELDQALKLLNRWPMTALFLDGLPQFLNHGVGR